MSQITLLSLLALSTIVYFKANCDTEQLQRRRNETVFSTIKESLSFFCPFGNICQQNSKGEEPKAGKRFCCKECSCADDCGLFKNCCFPEDDTYNLVDRSEYECIFPFSRELGAVEKTKYQSYYMIADGPVDKLVGHKDGNTDNETIHSKARTFRNMSKSCGEQNVKPWGPLFPVFSKSTGTIFKNEFCARAHGVKDGIEWLIGFTCEKDLNILLQLVEDLQKDDMIKTCLLYFYYPGNKNDIEIEQCYHERISDCPNTNFSPPAESNMTVDSVREACRSGFNAPYYGNKRIYRNVYCSVCNRDAFHKEGLCTDFNSLTRITSSGFTILIEPDILKSFVNDDTAIQNGRIACFQHGNSLIKRRDNKICRELKCPAGQLRRSNGKCYFVMNTFEVSIIGIYIKLTPVSRIELRHLSNIQSKIKHPKSNLNINVKFHAPMPKIWQANVAMDHLLAEVLCTVPRRNIKFILREIQKQITNPWVINIDDETVDLRPEFSEFVSFDYKANGLNTIDNAEFLPNGSDVSIISFPLGYDLFDGNSPKWFRLSSEISMNPHAFIITKLFICTQIDLKPSEYSLNSSAFILSSNLTKRTLFNGEFTVLKNTYGERVARICLEDSHFLTQNMINSGRKACLKRFIPLITFVLFLIKTYLLLNF